MMTIEEMNAVRSELGLTYQELCFRSGIPMGTIQKVLSGTTKNPRMETVRRLDETLSAMKSERAAPTDDDAAESSRASRTVLIKDRHDTAFSYAGKTEKRTLALREDAPAFGFAGRDALTPGGQSGVRFTAAYRESLPEERRTELIDGVLYDMASPSTMHQDICKAVCGQIDVCIQKSHSKCHSFLAPTDVCLNRDEYTVVQPDILIVCDRSQITRKNIQGAPAFVAEVLSPSTQVKDKDIKLWKYMHAGVQEYWIIDPDRQSIIVFDMTEKNDAKQERHPGEQKDPYRVTIHGFSDKIPLAISDGRCTIDMNPIREMLEELYPA